MGALAILLVAVAAGDVCRRLSHLRRVAPAVAVTAVAAGALLGGLWHLRDLVPLLGAATAAVAWQLLCGRAERTGRHQAMPLAMFGVAVAALILSSGLGSRVGGVIGAWTNWSNVVAGVPPERVLMTVGIILVQMATANQVVRLVLGSVGAVKPAGQPQASDQLKGGRLLGSMERLLIVGLGLAGQLAMASAVVAAKSIIRFPEISSKRNKSGTPDPVGIDDVTEYFLVGSFASWIVALGSLALVAASR
jgi:hypothetical protein